jgi:hypothetical protein
MRESMHSSEHAMETYKSLMQYGTLCLEEAIFEIYKDMGLKPINIKN